ncbi:MAG TPA: hypothetical protein VNZ45_17335 [Bacteroidia bacterium]|jgi:hypothetical protein|nr:hypothetical protein [Bacteroidia bacterium]
MAFDSVFQGPPSGVNAPGTAQSPTFGIDVTNAELYYSAGSGWQPIIGAGDISGSGTTGFVPKFTAGAVIGNSSIDDGVTSAGKVTVSNPLNVTSASSSSFTGNITSLGTGTNPFSGPVETPYTLPSVIYSVAGTPLPSPTGLEGARAFVSDATVATFASAYVGSSTHKVPVYCDGTGWFIG